MNDCFHAKSDKYLRNATFEPTICKTPTCGFSLLRDRLFKTWLQFCPKLVMFYIVCIEIVRVRGDSRANKNTALGACCRCQAEVFHESRERTCLQSTTLQLVQSQVPRSCQRRLMPSATWTIRGQRRLWQICPERPRCRRSNHVCVPEATGVGYHDGNSQRALLTQSPRLPPANRRRPKRQDMTTAAIWRIWSDVGIHGRENTWAGAKRHPSCAARHVVQHRGHARTERRCVVVEATKSGGHCVTADGVHKLAVKEGQSAVVSTSFP